MPEGPQPWVEAVKRIVHAVRRSDLSYFEIEHGDFHVRLTRELHPTAAAVDSRPGRRAERSAAANLHQVVAPLTGVFYRAPSATAKPYVSEGDWVGLDTVIGLIETMKIFNEVTADRAGRVAAFHAEAGQLVHEGDPLILLEPAERSAADPAIDLAEGTVVGANG